MNWGGSMRTPPSAHFPDVSCHEIREFPMNAPPPQVSDVGNAASDVSHHRKMKRRNSKSIGADWAEVGIDKEDVCAHV